MRIVYMGTPDFAVETLDALIREGHEIVGVVTTPDKPAGFTTGKVERPDFCRRITLVARRPSSCRSVQNVARGSVVNAQTGHHQRPCKSSPKLSWRSPHQLGHYKW